MELVIKGRQHLKLILLVGCGQLFLFSIHIAGFFDHQYLWKELNYLLDFLHGDNHQRKVTCETTFGCIEWVVPFMQSDCRIL